MTTTEQAETGALPLSKRLDSALREAVGRTMAEICGAPPVFLDNAPPWDGEGITSVIPYEGDSHFILAVSLPQDTATALCRTFTGVPIGWETEMMEDVVGELANVLAGDVVAELATHQFEARMALPRVERTMDLGQVTPDSRVLVELALSDGGAAYRVAMLVTDEHGADG